MEIKEELDQLLKYYLKVDGECFSSGIRNKFIGPNGTTHNHLQIIPYGILEKEYYRRPSPNVAIDRLLRKLI